MSVWDLERNDIEACHRLWLNSDVTEDDWRVMIALQDDPSALLEAARSWVPRNSTAALSDDDLDALSDLDTPHHPWDLPTEDDGGSPDESADADLRLDETWRSDAHGYNPYRSSDGKFASGAHRDTHGQAGRNAGGAARPWRLAFDATAHQRAMDAHRATEAVHRAKSLQIKERMASIRQQAQVATPKQRAALQRRYEQLAAQHEEHRSAAGAARDARVQTAKDLERARGEHAEQRRLSVAARSEAEWGRKRAEADSMLAIGQHRVAGSEGHSEVTPATHEPVTRQRVSEIEAHAVAQRAEVERVRRTTELEQRDLAQRLGVGNPLGTAVGAERRQVVHYAQPKLTQQQMNEHDAARRARELASDERAVARNTEAGLPHAAQTISLPPAHVVTKAHKYLAGILGK